MIPRADSPTIGQTADYRVQQKNSSSSLLGALRRLVVSPPRELVLCITAQEVLQIVPKGSPRMQVVVLREEMLKHQQEIFDKLPTKCPDITLNHSAHSEHRIVYRECNNYLLKPDSCNAPASGAAVTEFSYKGKSYIPKTLYPIQRLPSGLLCISGLLPTSIATMLCTRSKAFPLPMAVALAQKPI